MRGGWAGGGGGGAGGGGGRPAHGKGTTFLDGQIEGDACKE